MKIIQSFGVLIEDGLRVDNSSLKFGRLKKREDGK